MKKIVLSTFSVFMLISANTFKSQGFVTANTDTLFVPCPSCSGEAWSYGNTGPYAVTNYPFSVSVVLGVADNFSDEIQFRDFDLSIPPNSVVTGCEVLISQFWGGGTSVADSVVQLTYNGLPTGQNKALFSSWNPIADTVIYGSMTDTWGLNITAADVNNHHLGISYRIKSTGIVTASITDVRMRISYTMPTGLSVFTEKSIPYVFPNPVNNYLKLINIKNLVGSSYIIRDLQGKIILNGKINCEDDIIPCENLVIGTYFLEIFGKENRVVRFMVE